MEVKLDWVDFKSRVKTKSLLIQHVERTDCYEIWAVDGPVIYTHIMDKDDTAGEDQTDFETNYKSISNKPITTPITEDYSPYTNGHYQARSESMEISQQGITTHDVEWPIPIVLFTGAFVIKNENLNDEASVEIGPDTIVGIITSDVAENDTIISVSQSVIDNVDPGYYVKLYDGANTSSLARVLSKDKEALTLTVETASDNAFSASSPTYVMQTVRMVTSFKMCAEGQITLGHGKIGGSNIPAGTKLRLIYDNKTTDSKEFGFQIEYTY